MVEKTQQSFTGGEMSESLFGRTDLARYDASARLLENFFVHSFGGASNRSGTLYINDTKSHGLARLVRFQFNNKQAYILEFTNLLLRFYRDGAILGGPFELATPYTEDQLRDLKFTQSADVMTITHRAHDPHELARITDINWTLDPVVFGTIAVAPTGLSVSGDPEPATQHGIIGITQTIPGVVATSTNHNIDIGDDVLIKDVVGMVEVNAKIYRAIAVTATTIGLGDRYNGNPIDTTGFAAYVSGGTVSLNSGRTQHSYQVTSINATTFEESLPSTVAGNSLAELNQESIENGEFNTVLWNVVADTFRYNVYRQENGIYGYIGSTDDLSFEDRIASPDFTLSPPFNEQPFAGADDKPGTVTYFQQRLAFGGTNNDPQKIRLSQTGYFHNMNVSFPIKSDDAVGFVLNSNEVNDIEHLIPLAGGLVVLTSGAEWFITGGTGRISPITPTSISANLEEARGAANPKPIVIGNSILYVQNRGFFVRDLAFSFDSDGYTGNDLSLFANHLFKGHTILEWGYAQIPDTIVWAIRDDGILLGLTYQKDQNVWAWHQHNTQGTFESVATVPEGDEDAVYFVVRRVISGIVKRFVERLHTRDFENVRDAYFVDAGLSLDNPIAITAISQANPGTVTAVGHGLINGDHVDLSDVVGMTEVNLQQYIAQGVTANTFQLTHQYSGDPIDTTGFQAYVSGGFSRKAFNVVSGASHLVNMPVSVLGNGNVVPNMVVSGAGQITFASGVYYSRVHVGLGFTANLQTLDFSSLNLGSTRGKEKNVSRVVVQEQSTRGVEIGPNESELRPIKEREQEGWNEEIGLQNGDVDQIIDSAWSREGGVYIRCKDPLPATILSLTPNVQVSD